MQIPAPIQLYLDKFNREFTFGIDGHGLGHIFVRPDGVKVVDGLLGLVATVNIVGHEREIFVSNEECECMVFIDGDNPVEKKVFRAFGSEELCSILRDLRINQIMGQEEK